MTQIDWIKCSEKMPPDDDDFKVIFRKISLSRAYDQRPSVTTGALLHFSHTISNKFQKEWIPYDEEVWNELNK